MASVIYPKFKIHLAGGGFDWLTDEVAISYITSAYTPDYVNDEFLDPAADTYVVATTPDLTSKTIEAEATPATTVLLKGTVPVDVGVDGVEFDSLILHTSTGLQTTDRLIAYWDVFSGTYPLDPDNDDITVSAPAWLRI